MNSISPSSSTGQAGQTQLTPTAGPTTSVFSVSSSPPTPASSVSQTSQTQTQTPTASINSISPFSSTGQAGQTQTPTATPTTASTTTASIISVTDSSILSSAAPTSTSREASYSYTRYGTVKKKQYIYMLDAASFASHNSGLDDYRCGLFCIIQQWS